MTNYHAYLIRFWREDDGSPWRGELISPQTSEKRYFATADQLFAFLADQLPDNVTTEQREPTEPEKSRHLRTITRRRTLGSLLDR